MIAPKLRFSEFKDEWQISKLKDVCKINQGLQIAISERFLENGENRYFYITNEFLKEGSKKNYFIENSPKSVICNETDILMTRTGNTGQVVTDVDGAFHNNFFKIDYSRQVINKGFFVEFLRKESTQNLILKYAGASTIPDLNHSDFYKIEMIYPNLKEQTKIAEFLIAVDDKISQLGRQLELLNQYKKGVMQKIFSQEIRFKNDNGEDFGEWETTTLDNFLTVSKLKNKELTYSKNEVLSVSGELGIVNQIELLGRSYAGVSVAPYGIVEYGDIVYTKSPLKSNPYGIIKANKGKAGIVSTLYAVYKCNDNILPNLLDYYFQSDIKLNNYLRPLVRKGAKNDMKVNNQDVLNGVVCFPNSRKEQKIIIEFLTAIDERIDHTTAQLTHTKQWKKGLLQQMFV